VGGEFAKSSGYSSLRTVLLKAGNIAAWRNPEGLEKADIYKLVDDRERPYYEHQLAA
jgi:hypothetical protein